MDHQLSSDQDHARTTCRRAWTIRWRNPGLAGRAVERLLAQSDPLPETLTIAATIALFTGRLQRAEALALKAMAQFGQEEHAWYCRAATTCATIYYSTGRRDAASDLAHSALERVQHADAPDAHAGLLQLLGVTHLLSLDFDRALEILDEAHAICVEHGLISERVFMESNRARYLVRRGDFVAAQTWARIAQASLELHRLPVLEAYFGEVKGEIALANGQVYEAIDALEHALEIARGMGDRRASCHLLAVLGRAWDAAGLSQRALDVLRKGQAIADEMSYPLWQRRFRAAIAETFEKTGDLASALDAFKAFVEIDRELFNIETERRLAEMRASYELAEAQKVAAAERARSAELGKARAAAELLAWTDTLTSLRNRHALLSDLPRLLCDAQDEDLVLMLLDLDRFKQVNDTYGHDAGDAVLVAVAERVNAVLDGQGTCYRLGGDEFAVILNIGVSQDTAKSIATDLIPAIQEPVNYDGRGLFVGTSIGIAFNEQTAGDANELLRFADVALYEAKDAGRGQFRLYRPEVDRRIRTERELENDLRTAVKDGEFRLFLQPLVDAQSRSILGAECLLRWQHPRHGLLQPADFIEIVERGDMVFSVGDWVLRTGWDMLVELDRRFPKRKLHLSLNVSVRQFFDNDFLETLRDLPFRRAALQDRLELEITESTMIHNMDQAVSLMCRVGEMGYRLCIDDFGTGFSSIAQLAQLPVHSLKIDGSFLKGLDRTGASTTVVRSMVNLGLNLGLKVTAEGVETQDQARFLSENGCNRLQGYLYGRPMPWADFLSLLEQEKGAVLSRQG